MKKDKNIERARKELYFWIREPHNNNFSALLYTLISKADITNRYKLQKGFPEYVDAFDEYQNSKDPDELFIYWNLF